MHQSSNAFWDEAKVHSEKMRGPPQVGGQNLVVIIKIDKAQVLSDSSPRLCRPVPSSRSLSQREVFSENLAKVRRPITFNLWPRLENPVP